MLKFHFGYTPCTTGSERSLAMAHGSGASVWRMSLAQNPERYLGSRGDSFVVTAADIVAVTG
jgi:hypothetical protein